MTAQNRNLKRCPLGADSIYQWYMQTARVFLNGRSQAVRLPKEFRFEDDEVLIKRVGDAVVLLPKSKAWATLRAALNGFEPGGRLERKQPRAQRRARIKP